jgi:hypothetical protein
LRGRRPRPLDDGAEKQTGVYSLGRKDLNPQ